MKDGLGRGIGVEKETSRGYLKQSRNKVSEVEINMAPESLLKKPNSVACKLDLRTQ